MPAGRPPKLQIDPELQEQIVGYIKAGVFPDRAAVAAGVSERTHYLWQAKGLEERSRREEGKTPRKTWQVYLDYADAVEQAVAIAEVNLTISARASSESMKLLERRFRDRWSAKAAPPAASTPPSAKPSASVTPYDAFTERREARRGKRAGH